VIQVKVRYAPDKAKIDYHIARYFVHGQVKDLIKAIWHSTNTIETDFRWTDVAIMNGEEFLEHALEAYDINDIDEICKQLSDYIPEFEYLRVEKNTY